MLLTTKAGALILDIASQVEIIRLVFSLNDIQIVARYILAKEREAGTHILCFICRSLDECLLRPAPIQLQLVVSETPEILLQTTGVGYLFFVSSAFLRLNDHFLTRMALLQNGGNWLLSTSPHLQSST